MDYEWDPEKASANLHKHGIDFADAVIALEDDLALTQPDPDAIGEERLISLGTDASGQLLVTVFTQLADRIRIISSRRATRTERRDYEGI